MWRLMNKENHLSIIYFRHFYPALFGACIAPHTYTHVIVAAAGIVALFLESLFLKFQFKAESWKA